MYNADQPSLSKSKQSFQLYRTRQGRLTFNSDTTTVESDTISDLTEPPLPILHEAQLALQRPPNIIPKYTFKSKGLTSYLDVATAFGYFAAVCCIVCRSAFRKAGGIHFERACNKTVSQSFVILYLNIALLVSSNGKKENESSSRRFL